MLLAEMVGRPSSHGILLIVPILGLIMSIVMFIEVAKAFGKGAAYGLGLVLLPFIFFPLLGFGKTTYRGPVREPNNTSLF